jgi:hypothetical protein
MSSHDLQGLLAPGRCLVRLSARLCNGTLQGTGETSRWFSTGREPKPADKPADRMCNSWSRIETFATSFFNLDFVLTAPSQARTLTNVPSSQAASSTIRDLFGGNGTGPTRCLRAQGSGADGTRTGCIVRFRTNGRDSQERVGSPTRIPESRNSGEGLPSGRRLAKRPGQAKWCVAPSGCLGHLGSVRPEKPEDNVPITDSRIGYRAAPTVSRVFPFWSPRRHPASAPRGK